MMRHRLLAVNDDQAVDNVNERRPFDYGAERPVIRLRNDIPFHCAPNRVTLISPARIGSSTESSPNPPGRLGSRKRSLLVGLVSLKEPRTKPSNMRLSFVFSGSIEAGSQ
jgi:hypothetical protein